MASVEMIDIPSSQELSENFTESGPSTSSPISHVLANLDNNQLQNGTVGDDNKKWNKFLTALQWKLRFQGFENASEVFDLQALKKGFSLGDVPQAFGDLCKDGKRASTKFDSEFYMIYKIYCLAQTFGNVKFQILIEKFMGIVEEKKSNPSSTYLNLYDSINDFDEWHSCGSVTLKNFLVFCVNFSDQAPPPDNFFGIVPLRTFLRGSGKIYFLNPKENEKERVVKKAKEGGVRVTDITNKRKVKKLNRKHCYPLLHKKVLAEVENGNFHFLDLEHGVAMLTTGIRHYKGHKFYTKAHKMYCVI